MPRPQAPQAGMEVKGPSPWTTISPHVSGWLGRRKAPQAPGTGHFSIKAYYFEPDKLKLINVYEKQNTMKPLGQKRRGTDRAARQGAQWAGWQGPVSLSLPPSQAHSLLLPPGLLSEDEFASAVGTPGLSRTQRTTVGPTFSW